MQNAQRPTFTSDRLRKPLKPRAWNHQQELRELTDKMVTVEFRTGATLTGKLLAADQFTLKIEFSPGKASTVFKHALNRYLPG